VGEPDQHPHAMTNEDVIAIVQERFGLTRSQIMANRPKGGCMARFTAMWLCRSVLGRSYPDIAKSFLVHHTTVINAVNQVENYIETEPGRKEVIMELKAQIIKKISAVGGGIPGPGGEVQTQAVRVLPHESGISQTIPVVCLRQTSQSNPSQAGPARAITIGQKVLAGSVR
jgi:hypothetical protein